jgi:Transposase DDE domain
MPRPPKLTPWHRELASRFPDLPAPVLLVLALYSLGMILAGACGLSKVVLSLAEHLLWPALPLRKRLREFYLEAGAKSGAKQGQKRRQLDVAACFAPLLRWVLSLWSGRHLPLAIDVTNLGDRFHVLCVSVVVRGGAIPVAWKVLRGGVREPWNPHWQALLAGLRAAVPDGWTALVLSDRGLESADLFGAIVGLGWHPLMRVKQGGKFCPKTWHGWHGFAAFTRQPGTAYAAEGRAYTGRRLPCTLLARWAEGYAEPWLLLTDLPPEAGSAVWYALRAWIEQGFKALKGGGWDWQYTRMEDPERVERLWLVLAVATLWVTAVGAEEEVRQQQQAEQRRLERELSETAAQAEARRQRERLRQEKARQGQQQQRQQRRRPGPPAEKQAAAGKARPRGPGRKGEGAKPRVYRVAARGLAVLAGLWGRGETRLPQSLHPEPWPPPSHTASTLTEQEFLSQPT